LSNKQIPYHVGLIIDGNRRWAKINGKAIFKGHKQGAKVFKIVSLGLFERGVTCVSAYLFSTENWNRSKKEVSYLMGLATKAVSYKLSDFNKLGIKICVIGTRDNLSKKVIKAIDRVEAKTAKNKRGTLLICFNYGGRQEIVDATKAIVRSKIRPEKITADTIASKLYAPDIPDVDLVIRTSGEQRLSGFMLWRIAYSEMTFVRKLWPDVTLEDMDNVLLDYKNRERRFGC